MKRMNSDLCMLSVIQTQSQCLEIEHSVHTWRTHIDWQEKWRCINGLKSKQRTRRTAKSPSNTTTRKAGSASRSIADNSNTKTTITLPIRGLSNQKRSTHRMYTLASSVSHLNSVRTLAFWTHNISGKTTVNVQSDKLCARFKGMGSAALNWEVQTSFQVSLTTT